MSATTFTVIGILCKLGTLVVNTLMWDKHASPTGMSCLLVCMTAGFFYQQAPMRASAVLSTVKVADPTSKAEVRALPASFYSPRRLTPTRYCDDGKVANRDIGIWHLVIREWL